VISTATLSTKISSELKNKILIKTSKNKRKNKPLLWATRALNKKHLRLSLRVTSIKLLTSKSKEWSKAKLKILKLIKILRSNLWLKVMINKFKMRLKNLSKTKFKTFNLQFKIIWKIKPSRSLRPMTKSYRPMSKRFSKLRMKS